MADPSGIKIRVVLDADIPPPAVGKIHMYWIATGPRYKGSDGVPYSFPSVDSFNGRTGAVVPLVGDYDLFFLTPAEGDAAYVPLTRTMTAGAGLTGGGSLAADRTFDVVANADGSIVVNANDVQVGVLATDAQHGARGGGTDLHPDVVPAGLSGFMTGADKAKLDGIAVDANVSRCAVTWGSAGVGSTTTTRYLAPGYEDAVAPTVPAQWRVPFDGTLRRFSVRHNVGAGNGSAVVYTLRINDVGSALSASLASTASDGTDLVDDVAVVAGDRVDIEVTKAASIAVSPTDIMASLEYAAS